MVESVRAKKELTQEYVKSVVTYDEITGVLTWSTDRGPGGRIKAGTQAGSFDAYGYRQIGIDGKVYKEHRIIYLLMTGSTPKQVDHINLNKADNRWINLRDANGQNRHNVGRSANNTSGFKGVHWVTKAKKWRAQIKLNGKLHYLGLFDVREEAAADYEKAAKELHKEFARI